MFLVFTDTQQFFLYLSNTGQEPAFMVPEKDPEMRNSPSRKGAHTEVLVICCVKW